MADSVREKNKQTGNKQKQNNGKFEKHNLKPTIGLRNVKQKWT